MPEKKFNWNTQSASELSSKTEQNKGTDWMKLKRTDGSFKMSFEDKYPDLIKIAEKNKLDLSFIKNQYNDVFSPIKKEIEFNTKEKQSFSNSALKNVMVVNPVSGLNKQRYDEVHNLYKDAKRATNEFLQGFTNKSENLNELLQNAYLTNEKLKLYLDPKFNANVPTTKVYDKQSDKLIDKKEYYKKLDEPIVKYDQATGKYISTSTLDSSSDAAYKTLRDFEIEISDRFMGPGQKLMKSWTTNSSKLLTRYAQGTGQLDTDDIDNVQKSYSLFTDILNHTSKYGTVGKNLKDVSSNLLNQLNKIKEPKDKYNFLAKNKETLADITNHLGFYGTKSMYNKYKDIITSPDFHDKDGPNRDELDHIIRLHDDFKKVDIDARTKAKEYLFAENLETGLSEYFPVKNNVIVNSFLFEKNNRINSFEDYKKAMLPHFLMPYQMKPEHKNNPEYKKMIAWQKRKYEEAAQDVDKALRDSYNYLTLAYQDKFNEVKVDNGQTVQARLAMGFGNKTANIPMYVGLDFTSKNSTANTNKFKNVSKVLDLVNSEKGIYFFNKDVTKKMQSFMTDDELLMGSDTGLDSFNKFFKDAGDNVSASFLAFPKGTKTHAAYVFKDEDTGKEIAAMIPNNLLEKINDPLFEASKYTSEDFVYDYLGEKPVYNSPVKSFKNLHIGLSKDNEYIGYFNKPSEDFPGSYERISQVLGSTNSLTWEDAENYFKDILTRYNTLLQNYK